MCKQLVLLCILLLPFAGNICAQETIFLARANNTKVGINETVELEYTITNADDIKLFQLPSFAPFSIIAGPNTRKSVTTFNGQRNTRTSYVVSLLATKTGVFNFRPAKASLSNSTIHSNSVEIEVSNTSIGKKVTPAPPAATPPPASTNTATIGSILKDLFSDKGIESSTTPIAPPKKKINITDKVFAIAELDKREVYAGEQVIVSYNLYAQVPVKAMNKKYVTPSGFWLENFAKTEQDQMGENVVINKKDYRKYTIKKVALFPMKAGMLVIPPITINGVAQIENASNASGNGILDMFENMLNAPMVEELPFEASTDSLQLLAKNLPPHNNPEFKGAVGDYTFESNIDKSEISTDEYITINYIVRGTGNLKLINDPTTYFSGDFETSDPKYFDTVTSSAYSIAGYKTFSITLIPRNPSNAFIPAASFTFFNPNTGEYQTLKSKSYEVKVRPGSKHKALSKNKGLPQDIHDIMNDSDIKKDRPELLINNNAYWLAYLIPLLLYISAVIIKKYRKQKLSHAPAIGKVNSHIAEHRLQVAYEYLKQNKTIEFFTERNKAIWLYLSDKLNTPLSKIDKASIQDTLAKQGVSEEVIIQLMKVNKESESILYGGASTSGIDMQIAYNEGKELLFKLEKHFS
jgi:hypothetical protein